MEILRETIEANYPELTETLKSIENANWNRLLSGSTMNDQKKKKSQVKRFSEQQKLFLSIQKILIYLGNTINNNGNSTNTKETSIFNIRIEAKNYDELITNINWKNHFDGIKMWYEIYSLCEVIFEEICSSFAITIRTNTTQLIMEILESYYKGNIEKRDEIRKWAQDMEKSCLVYAILMGVETNNINTISWETEVIRTVYHVKLNTIIASLSNVNYCEELIKKLEQDVIMPIEIAFMKRSQLLSKKYEDIETNKLKLYEESGITKEDDDYTNVHSTVQCTKCKSYHTEFMQLQTRGADEPMTIFWYCRKCKERGRK